MGLCSEVSRDCKLSVKILYLINLCVTRHQQKKIKDVKKDKWKAKTLTATLISIDYSDTKLKFELLKIG